MKNRRERWACGRCDRRCVLKINSAHKAPPSACVMMETVDEGDVHWYLLAATRCEVCGRFIKAKDPRRSLAGNTERHNHGYAGATHQAKEGEQEE